MDSQCPVLHQGPAPLGKPRQSLFFVFVGRPGHDSVLRLFRSLASNDTIGSIHFDIAILCLRVVYKVGVEFGMEQLE
jgi:hypothetical protein